ncbi:hypothetical protein SK128_025203 [Halocaridina rubra]|uniref:Uncharacterized protein n=1 Tax=Halocaridina rubra TaxID=373956 RepID=A0AAN9A3Y3_HALRR
MWLRSRSSSWLRPLLVASVMLHSVLAYESFIGSCPSVPSVEDFDMEKFAGTWYVVESFDEFRWCVTWNITKGSDYGVWKLVESEESGVVYDLGLKHSNFYAAELSQPDTSNPGKLKIRWRLSISSSDFTVHSTDYNNYAGIFECQNMGLFHRQNGIVLSRKPGLKGAARQLARIRTSDVKVEYFKPVRQYSCSNRPQEN